MSTSRKRVKTSELHVYTTPEFHVELYDAARVRGVSVSEFVRVAIEKLIKETK